MATDKQAARAAFEADQFADVAANAPAREREGDGYRFLVVDANWGIWQAAWRASRNLALPIEAAPKDERLLLFFPAFGEWTAAWWPGSWSWTREQWAIHSPFSAGNKALFGTDAPQPTHWKPLPPPPVIRGLDGQEQESRHE